MDTRLFAYGSAALALVGAVGSFVLGGGIFGMLSGLFCLFGAMGAVAFFKYGYILVPFITTRSNVVLVTDTGYEIPPSQEVILKNMNGIYYASMFLGVKVYESASERGTDENVVYTEYFERAISSVKYVTKFSMLVYVKDITEYRKNIETKHAEAQLRLAKEREKAEPDVLRLDRYEREVAMWDSQINKLSQGIKPMGMVAYVMTTATGVSKEAAAAAAKSQANELRSTLANALNVEITNLKGDEMMRCFDWEHIIPPTQTDLEQATM
ncbi:hypothetical protein J4441_05820 [Candidatus Micrarchaeota archaeon]|nr:hypothetical protein [Candidatus Micrarchaeota archaeon]